MNEEKHLEHTHLGINHIDGHGSVVSQTFTPGMYRSSSDECSETSSRYELEGSAEIHIEDATTPNYPLLDIVEEADFNRKQFGLDPAYESNATVVDLHAGDSLRVFDFASSPAPSGSQSHLKPGLYTPPESMHGDLNLPSPNEFVTSTEQLQIPWPELLRWKDIESAPISHNMNEENTVFQHGRLGAKGKSERRQSHVSYTSSATHTLGMEDIHPHWIPPASLKRRLAVTKKATRDSSKQLLEESDLVHFFTAQMNRSVRSTFATSMQTILKYLGLFMGMPLTLFGMKGIRRRICCHYKNSECDLWFLTHYHVLYAFGVSVNAIWTGYLLYTTFPTIPVFVLPISYALFFDFFMLAPLCKLRRRSRNFIFRAFKLYVQEMDGNTSSWIIPYSCFFLASFTYGFILIFFYQNGGFLPNLGSLFGLFSLLFSIAFVLVQQIVVTDVEALNDLQPSYTRGIEIHNFLKKYYGLKPVKTLTEFHQAFKKTEKLSTMNKFFESHFPKAKAQSAKKLLRKYSNKVKGVEYVDATLAASVFRNMKGEIRYFRKWWRNRQAADLEGEEFWIDVDRQIELRKSGWHRFPVPLLNKESNLPSTPPEIRSKNYRARGKFDRNVRESISMHLDAVLKEHIMNSSSFLEEVKEEVLDEMRNSAARNVRKESIGTYDSYFKHAFNV